MRIAVKFNLIRARVVVDNAIVETTWIHGRLAEFPGLTAGQNKALVYAPLSSLGHWIRDYMIKHSGAKTFAYTNIRRAP